MSPYFKKPSKYAWLFSEIWTGFRDISMLCEVGWTVLNGRVQFLPVCEWEKNKKSEQVKLDFMRKYFRYISKTCLICRHICEIQIYTMSLFNVSEKGHSTYVEFRDCQAK